MASGRPHKKAKGRTQKKHRAALRCPAPTCLSLPLQADLLAVWVLLIATVVATFFLQRQRERFHFLPPAAAALVFGILTGVALRAAGMAHTLHFSPDTFFFGLLPPVIFAAGLTMRSFFGHLAPISLFAVGGTLISTAVVGLATYLLVLLRIVKRAHLGPHPLAECFLFGAALSATDTVATLATLTHVPVPPILFHLVSGESVLNDAASVVLFHTLAGSYAVSAFNPLRLGARFAVVLGGSIGLGAAVALGCAFILKRFELDPLAGSSGGGGGAGGSDDGGGGEGPTTAWAPAGPGQPSHPAHAAAAHPAAAPGPLAFAEPTVYETCLVLMGAYLAYLLAESAGMSGIVSLFAAGVATAHYSLHSVTPAARAAIVGSVATAAFLAEAFVFAYLGIQVPLQAGRAGLDWGLLVCVVPIMVAARAAAVFPLARALNARPAATPLPSSVQRVLALAGLRGAVAYALILRLPSVPGESLRGVPCLEAAVLAAAVVSTLGLGPAIRPALAATGLLGATDADVAVAGLVEVRGLAPGVAAERVAAGEAAGPPPAWHAWRDLDDRVLKPLFGGRAGGSGAGGGGGGGGAPQHQSPGHHHPPPPYGRGPPPPGGGGGAIPELEPLSSAAMESALYVPPDPFAPQAG
jgi:NhaP-type Na+/H+ or K+/H+ antiporter